MRISPAAVAVPLLIALLTWLSWRAVNSEAELFDRALSALDQLAIAENGLDRDVLRARAGILRNYDPLVREVDAADEWLARLRASTADAKSAAAVDRLAASLARQEALVEEFKSNNALLQNSLAYFERFSAELGAPDQSGPVAPAVSALAAAMLRLSLDTSSETAREVDARLEALENQPVAPESREVMHGLLAHARKLRQLLPATAGILKAMAAEPQRQNRSALRAALLAQQSASRATARWFRVLLYLTSLLLVGVLAYLGLRSRARSRALARRATFEHVLASLSMRFINARPQDLDGAIEQALAEMAACVAADRAYLLLSGPAGRTYVWCRKGIALPPDWPDQAPTLAARFSPAIDGIIHLPDVNHLAPGPDRDACRAFGLRAWACAPGMGANGSTVVLGFDSIEHPCRIILRAADLSLLRMARDTLVNAVERQLMEQERGRLETRLQQARRMETVGALASGIAHNFNNIIGAILGYAEMAEAQLAVDSRPARNLDEIRRAGERARDLIDQILAFGRRRDARRRPLSVRAMLAEAASLLRASLPPGIHLVIREPADTAPIRGEPAQLQQVILNLCRNAAEAMDGAGTIEIEAEMHDIGLPRRLSHGELAPGRYVRIAVSDTGRGISKPVMERIFEPFFTTRLTGNGLGLATVREIVREHGGTMDVWSAVGVGSRFELWLPCTAALDPAPAEEAPALPFGHGETVLVIDDDRDRLLGDEDMLAALGYEPIGFADPRAALRSCRDAVGRYDALVVAGLISTAAAVDLAAALRETAPDAPILLATGTTQEIGVGLLMAAGISEVVGRPLVASEIAAALKRCLADRSRSLPRAGSAR